MTGEAILRSLHAEKMKGMKAIDALLSKKRANEGRTNTLYQQETKILQIPQFNWLKVLEEELNNEWYARHLQEHELGAIQEVMGGLTRLVKPRATQQQERQVAEEPQMPGKRCRLSMTNEGEEEGEVETPEGIRKEAEVNVQNPDESQPTEQQQHAEGTFIIIEEEELEVGEIRREEVEETRAIRMEKTTTFPDEAQ